MSKDILEQDLVVGDYVVLISKGERDICFGRVVKFTPTAIRVVSNAFGGDYLIPKVLKLGEQEIEKIPRKMALDNKFINYKGPRHYY